MRARVRGIYTTAVTRRLLDADHDVVQASPSIRERFDVEFPVALADVSVTTTDDRQGVGASGDPDAVAAVREDLAGVAVDALAWAYPAPEGGVFLARVRDALGSGAVVDLGEREGFLPYGNVDDRVEEGDVLRVQIVDPEPPWGDDRPVVAGALRVTGGLLTLDRARSGVSADARGERATKLVRTTELLDATAPDGWGVRWERAAVDADIATLGTALEDAIASARVLEDVPAGDVDDAPTRLDTADATDWRASTAWVWFGRESRFALDDDRRRVETTMPGHHRVKAGSASASDAVDFAEGVHAEAGGDWGDDLPFAAVADAFGPREGDRFAIEHGKPEGRRITLGRGRVTTLDPEAKTLTVERDMTGGGTYDALGTRREDGDVAVTKLTEGKWWYPTRYRSESGETKGTYVNVCTPVELFPDGARYVDLHVDVVEHADGTVERVDDDELDAAVDAGHVPEPLADRARTVAKSVERALK